MIYDTSTSPRAALHTLGCRLNESETNLIRDKLVDAGYEIVPFGEDADLAVINTCTVTAQADAKCRNIIRQFVRKNPEGFTAVVGCYSQLGYKAISEIDGVDLIIGNQEKLNVMDYVKLGKNEKPLVIRDSIVRDDFSISYAGDATVSQRSNLKIQDGCSFMCSFCVIPFARGRARSREMANLLEEARSLIDRGARELILTGVNVGTYDFDGRSIVDVVNALNDLDGLDRIRISSIEPTTIPERLLDMMNDAQHKLVPYLHIPLQSGCDRVLELMKRRYTSREFLDFVLMADERVKDLCIGTDILVGSPGETEADFEESCEFFEKGPFAYSHVFTYSEREGTPAVDYEGSVPVDERKRRNARLRKLSEQKRSHFDSRWIGRPVEVLFENCSDGYWGGYTDNYVRVIARSEKNLDNQMLKVMPIEQGPEFLVAEDVI